MSDDIPDSFETIQSLLGQLKKSGVNNLSEVLDTDEMLMNGGTAPKTAQKPAPSKETDRKSAEMIPVPAEAARSIKSAAVNNNTGL